MDYFILSAPAINKKGDTGVLSIKDSERDSECTSEIERLMKLRIYADKLGVTITGPMTIEDDPERGK